MMYYYIIYYMAYYLRNKNKYNSKVKKNKVIKTQGNNLINSKEESKLYDDFVSSENYCYHQNFKSNEVIRGLHQQGRWKSYEKINEYYKIVFDNESIFFGNIKKDQIEGFGIYCSFDFSKIISTLSDLQKDNINIESFYNERVKRDKLNFSSEKIFSFCYIGNFKYGNFHGKGKFYTYFKGSYLITECDNWKIGFEHKKCTIRHNKILIAKNEKFTMGTHDKHKKSFLKHHLYNDELSFNDLINESGEIKDNYGLEDPSEFLKLCDMDFRLLYDSKTKQKIESNKSEKFNDEIKNYELMLGINS